MSMLTWNTIEVVKEKMRLEDAEYGGEMSAHHYFKSFGCCDSGMIPWLLIVELLSRKQSALSALVSERISQYPSPGEINTIFSDVDKLFATVKQKNENETLNIDEIDGLSFEFETWRFNLRASNTEPVIRLNVESRRNMQLMKEKMCELLEIIKSQNEYY